MIHWRHAVAPLFLGTGLVLGCQGAFAQDGISCGGLSIVSLEPSDISSQIDGELATFSFDLAATIENVSGQSWSAASPLNLLIASGGETLEVTDLTELAPGAQLSVKAEVEDWSPYSNPGFVAAIVAPGGEIASEGACSRSINGTELEQLLRGH